MRTMRVISARAFRTSATKCAARSGLRCVSRPHLDREPAQPVRLVLARDQFDRRRQRVAERRAPIRLGDGQHRVDHLAEGLLRDGDDHLVLAAEVPVDRAGRQPRLREQVLHGRLVEPVADEAAARGVQDLLASIGEVLLGHLGHEQQHKGKRMFVLTDHAELTE